MTQAQARTRLPAASPARGPAAPARAPQPGATGAAAPRLGHSLASVGVLRREPAPEARREEPQPPPTPATPVPIRTVKVWLNAFIPKDVPGKSIPAVGPHAGKTMLNGPVLSECYLTDNRDFDAAIHAPSRMHAEIEIDVSGPAERSRWVDCDETHEINCTTGAAVCTKKGSTSAMTFSAPRGTAASLIELGMAGASNNPCYTGSPDIDYEGKVSIDVPRRTVSFDGKIDDFPAFEMYATANAGAGSPLFKTPPLPGMDPWDLPGKAARAQTGWTAI